MSSQVSRLSSLSWVVAGWPAALASIVGFRLRLSDCFDDKLTPDSGAFSWH